DQLRRAGGAARAQGRDQPQSSRPGRPPDREKCPGLRGMRRGEGCAVAEPGWSAPRRRCTRSHRMYYQGKSMGLFTRSSSTTTPAVIPPAPSPVDADSIVTPPAMPVPDTAPVTVAPSPQSLERQQYLQQLKTKLHQQLVERLDVQNLKTVPPDVLRVEVRNLVRDLCNSEKSLLSSADQDKLMDDIMDETFGLGPLEQLLKDPAVSDILVNRWDRVYCERRGRLELSEVRFRDNAHLRQIIDRIVGLVGRRIDETSPMVDARLADGSRVNAIIPPLALDGPAMSVRRFGARPMQLEDLIRSGAFPSCVMDFLSAAVQARCNILISGGTGSGKTTLLNCLSRYIPTDERVITI